MDGMRLEHVSEFKCVLHESGDSEAFRRGGLKVNADKSKVMVLGGEEGLECEVWVDGMRVEHVSEFKYLGCVLDESSADEA